jgi:molecular chaperone Hsp33
MLGADEVKSILTERENIEVNCDFCNQLYQFDAIDAAALFVKETVINVSDSTH